MTNVSEYKFDDADLGPLKLAETMNAVHKVVTEGKSSKGRSKR